MGEVRRLFGGSCHFIHLNSQPPDEQSSAMDDIWSNGVDLAYLEQLSAPSLNHTFFACIPLQCANPFSPCC